MKTHSLFILLLSGFTLPAIAQQGPPQGPPPDPLSMALDRDRDGELSRSEIRRAARALLRLDENDDGELSEEELRPKPPRRRRGDENNQGPPPKPPVSALFTALDADENGTLSAQELEAAADSLKELDIDDNGRLSSEESGLKPPQPMNGQGGGPGRGGPPPRGPRR